jgi:maleamate amidohydrolase
MDERVWDRFLSPQDREDLKTRSRGTVGFGERPALLMVDLYRWVFGDQPLPLAEAKKEWPSSCGLAAWKALPFLVTLRDAARAAGIPIVYSRDNPNTLIRDWAKSSGKPSPIDQESAKWKHRFEIVEEVAPRPEDVVIVKEAPSAFWSSPLLAHLVSQGINTLIVGGESTSGCLRATVVDGCSYRFKMIIAEECAFDRHEASHAINLFDLNQKYADVLPLSEILSYLDKFN